jgi:cell wall-associated NlpC family hydrolase
VFKDASWIGFLALALAACGGPAPSGDVGENTEAEALSPVSSHAGTRAEVNAQHGLNLRRAPNTNAEIILTMPKGAVVELLAQSGPWFSVSYDQKLGWAHGSWLAPLSGSAPSPPPGSSGSSGSSGGTGTDPGPSGSGAAPGPSGTSTPIEEAIARAESGLGFSYHWGGGCWQPGSSSHGACYGSCPNCSHSGKWGADCSGYLSKIWQVPGAEELTHCSHPYSTTEFYDTHAHWRDVPRSQAKCGDAFVRHGHIFLFSGGDAWGAIRAYEAKGCRTGIVHDNRTADSSYKVIRRNGF